MTDAERTRDMGDAEVLEDLRAQRTARADQSTQIRKLEERLHMAYGFIVLLMLAVLFLLFNIHVPHVDF